MVTPIRGSAAGRRLRVIRAATPERRTGSSDRTPGPSNIVTVGSTSVVVYCLGAPVGPNSPTGDADDHVRGVVAPAQCARRLDASHARRRADSVAVVSPSRAAACRICQMPSPSRLSGRAVRYASRYREVTRRRNTGVSRRTAGEDCRGGLPKLRMTIVLATSADGGPDAAFDQFDRPWTDVPQPD
jgi:hypothetical protein